MSGLSSLRTFGSKSIVMACSPKVLVATGLPTLFPRVALPTLPEISITIESPINNSYVESLKEKLANAFLPLPEAVESLWNGILNAAPKKKVSHQKKRQRQYAPGHKHLQNLNNLNRCPSCGHYKRAHTLCMNCVGEIRKHWKQLDAKKQQLENEKLLEKETEDETISVAGVEESVKVIDERINYPGKRTILDPLKHVEKEEYLKRRPKSLPVENKSDPK